MLKSVPSGPPVRLTLTFSRPTPSMLTWPWIPAVRRYVPSKLTIFDSPTPTATAEDVLENPIASSSKPEISTE